MKIRSARERAIQTLAYEACGLVVVTPLYGLAMGASGHDSLVMLASVAMACMVWAAVHNTCFDWMEARLTGRVASDRSQAMRMVHAISHETSSILVTTPVIMVVGGYGLWPALLVDFGLTLAYTGYAYVFHIVYDRLRPVRRTARRVQRHTPAAVVTFPKRPVYRGGAMAEGRRRAA